MAEITYRRPEVSDAKNIVDFYNYVGGETSYLSFEKDEYPLDAAAQEAAIRELEGNDTNIMLLAMDGEEIAGIATISSTHKIKARHDVERELRGIDEAVKSRTRQDTMASWGSL